MKIIPEVIYTDDKTILIGGKKLEILFDGKNVSLEKCDSFEVCNETTEISLTIHTKIGLLKDFNND